MSKKQFLYVLLFSLLVSIPVYQLLYSCLLDTTVKTEYQTVEHLYFSEQPPQSEAPCAYANTIYTKKTQGSGEYQKITYVIDIDTLYSEKELDAIADYYAAQEVCPRVFVEFFLTTQDKSGPNYALSKRSPEENTTEIHYTAPELKAKDVTGKPYPFEGCKIYGKWDLGVGGYMVFYQKNKKCYRCTVYNGCDSELTPELFYKTTFKGHTAFQNAEDENDLYAIENGLLVGYFQGDEAATFNPIQ